MNLPSDRPHPLELERWLLSEQDEAQRARTEARLDQAERARLRREDEALREQLLTRLPPARFADRVRERARPRPVVPWVLGVGLAAACAFFLLARTPALEPSERAKGQAVELRLYRQRGAGIERLQDGALVGAHETLQLGYLRAGHRHGVVLSIDGRGGVTLHAPRGGQGSSSLSAQGGEQLLPDAFELDDAPDFERFFFVAADAPLDVEEVLAAARSLARDPRRARSEPLALDTPHQLRTVMVRKSAAP